MDGPLGAPTVELDVDEYGYVMLHIPALELTMGRSI